MTQRATALGLCATLVAGTFCPNAAYARFGARMSQKASPTSHRLGDPWVSSQVTGG